MDPPHLSTNLAVGWIARVPQEPFKVRVERLAAERGMTVSELRFAAYDPKAPGTNPNTTASAITGRRPITRPMIEAFARVLRVPPSDFPEYRLMLLREQLDPTPANLDAAVELLEALEAATQTAAVTESRHASGPPSTSDQPRRASARGRPKARGA